MRISREHWLMEMAELTALRGTCSRLQVGAVIAKDSRIISSGYNGAPAGLPHCDHDGTEERCTTAVHAEANAIAYAARRGIATEGAELYVTHQPCEACAQLIINAGLCTVIFRHPYRLQDGINLLERARVVVWELT